MRRAIWWAVALTARAPLRRRRRTQWHAPMKLRLQRAVLAAKHNAFPVRLNRLAACPRSALPPLIRVIGARVSHEQKCSQVGKRDRSIPASPFHGRVNSALVRHPIHRDSVLASPLRACHRADRSSLRRRTVPQHPLDLRVTAIAGDFGRAQPPDHIPASLPIPMERPSPAPGRTTHVHLATSAHVGLLRSSTLLRKSAGCRRWARSRWGCAAQRTGPPPWEIPPGIRAGFPTPDGWVVHRHPIALALIVMSNARRSGFLTL